MNIYSAKFMNEASASLSDKVFKNQINETYLYSTMNILREMNSVINENTKQMYIQIAEAESKSDENKIFANYFYQFKQIFQDFTNKVNEMKSRMIISIENKMETWDELITDDQYIASFDKEFNYSGYNFFHIEDADYPRLNLNKIYQKEFDYIGQLMQDNNGVEASSNAKLKIIASVSNNFVKSSGDKDWVRCFINDMVDIDEKEMAESYSECIYNSLRDKYDFNVTKSTLYTCKERLSDYEDIIDAAVKLCDSVIADVNKVSENIASYLFRNNDNKLKIKTDTDGIIDRDYRLDTYSMNQLDLFMNNKINQMKKVLNIYAIAIGIKFDTAVDYICQNIDILNTAKNYYNGTIEIDDEDDSDDEMDKTEDDKNDMDDAEDNSDDLDNDTTEDDEDDSDDLDDISTDDMETVPEEDEEKDPIDEEPDDDMSGDESELDLDVESNNFDEAYLFEATLFEMETMQENANMYMELSKSLMLEEDQQNNTNSTLQNVQKTADKLSGWQAIVQKLANLWKKFKELVITNSGPKIEYLKKNAKYLKTDLKNEVKLRFTPDINKLQSIDIPDLNNDTLKYLENEDDFISKYFKDFKSSDTEGSSLSQNIKSRILGKEQSGPANFLSMIKVDDAYNFCINYQSNTNNLRAQSEAIEKAQRVAKDITKVEIGESSRNNNFMQYFNEFEETKNANTDSGNNTNGNQQNSSNSNQQNTDNTKKVALYFRICSQVLAAEMTCYQSLFNEFYSFCKWWIRTASGSNGNSNGNNKSVQKKDDVIKMN